jgi:hypothetical protein
MQAHISPKVWRVERASALRNCLKRLTQSREARKVATKQLVLGVVQRVSGVFA